MNITTNNLEVAAILVAMEMTRLASEISHDWSASVIRAEYVINLQTIMDTLPDPNRGVQDFGNQDIYVQ